MVTTRVPHEREWNTIGGICIKGGREEPQMTKQQLKGTDGNFLQKGDYPRYVYTLSLILKEMISITSMCSTGSTS